MILYSQNLIAKMTGASGAALLLVCLVFANAHAIETGGLEEGAGEGAAMPLLEDRVDDLLADLKRASSNFDVAAAQKAIADIFSWSGSATTDLLMGRAGTAVQDNNPALALLLLDRVTDLQPDFTEGYYRRGLVYLAQGNYVNAAWDFKQVVKLEPRHFIALRSLGFALMETGDERGALDVFRKALHLNPHMDDIARAVEAISARIERRGI